MWAASPFGLIAQAIRRTAKVLDGEPAALQQRKLGARLSRHLQSEALLSAREFLGEISNIPAPDEGRPKLRAARQDIRLMADHVRLAFLDWLRAECEASPLVFVLEDLHWGDAATVRLLDAALRELEDKPLFVLALARPEVHELFPRLWAD